MPARSLLTTTLSCTQKPLALAGSALHPTSHQRPLPCSSWTNSRPASNSVIPLIAEALKPIEPEASLLEKNSESRARPCMLLMPTESLLWMREYCTKKSEPADPAAMALPVPWPVPLAPLRSTHVTEMPLPRALSRLSVPLPTSLTTGVGFVAGPTEASFPGSASSLSPALRRATAETSYVPACTQKRVAVPEGSLLMMASMSSPCVICVPLQSQLDGGVTGHPLLEAGPGCVSHRSVESGTPSRSVSVGEVDPLAHLLPMPAPSSSLCPGL